MGERKGTARKWKKFCKHFRKSHCSRSSWSL